MLAVEHHVVVPGSRDPLRRLTAFRFGRHGPLGVAAVGALLAALISVPRAQGGRPMTIDDLLAEQPAEGEIENCA